MQSQCLHGVALVRPCGAERGLLRPGSEGRCGIMERYLIIYAGSNEINGTFDTLVEASREAKRITETGICSSVFVVALRTVGTGDAKKEICTCVRSVKASPVKEGAE